MKELYAVCGNGVLCVESVLCCCMINSVYALCVVVAHMMQKSAPMGVTVQPDINEDNEIPEGVLLGGASIKVNCSSTHIHIQNDTKVLYDDSLRKLVCFIMGLKN